MDLKAYASEIASVGRTTNHNMLEINLVNVDEDELINSIDVKKMLSKISVEDVLQELLGLYEVEEITETISNFAIER